MSQDFAPFATTIGSLPQELAIFPLPCALLLPGGRLPLNIFEPRYLKMVLDAMQTPTRLIGMVQPQDGESMEDTTPLFPVGCAGRISSFAETEDGRILITLHGVARFKIKSERLTDGGYRCAQADWSAYAHDLDITGTKVDMDRALILENLKCYLKKYQMAADWDLIEQAPDCVLVTTLAMVCPFGYKEQQALIEAPTLSDRAAIISCLLKMAVHNKDCSKEH